MTKPIINTNESTKYFLHDTVSECPCPRIRCKNHSDCEKCIKKHSKKKNEPYCYKINKNINE